jgi:flagellin
VGTPFSINTNIASLSVHRHLNKSGWTLNQSIMRLSSGLKINSAADDAAGLAVSQGLRAQIGGFKQAMENAGDAMSILATAEGAYNSISDVLIRMRELAVQSANDSLTGTERAYLDTEFGQLINEITRISDVSEFNGIKLLDGTAGDGLGNLVFQIGTRNSVNDQVNVTLGDQDATTLGVNGLQVDSLANAQGSITVIDDALSALATDRATIGATVNRLSSAVDYLGLTIENLSAANSQIRDTDVAAESARFAKTQVIMQAGIAMMAQANAMPQMMLRLLG